MYDVVVVGGGLAGAATAIHLARAGRTVVVLERAAVPRRKACGEGLFPRGVAELAQLGVHADGFKEVTPLEGVCFRAGSATAVARFASPGAGIQRALLDPLLLAAAEAAGAEVRRGVAVTGLARDGRRVAGVATDAGPVAASVAVGADGLNSRVRRLSGLDSPHRGHRFGVTAHVRLSAPSAMVDVHFRGGQEVYVTPVGADIANVALLMSKAAMRPFAGRLREAFLDALAGEPGLQGCELLDEPLAAGPFFAACRRAWRANVVLAGDSAGFFDGISGEGMSAALAGARIAAAAVDRYLATGAYRHFRDYERARRTLVRNSNLLARVSLALGRSERTAAWAVRNLGRRPATFEKLVAISAGESGLRALRPRDLGALAFGL